MEKIDRLNRGEFIKFVEDIIVNYEKYKRSDDSSAYVMALDSPWGTGKSYFIDLLIEDIKNNDGIKVVKYNAWKNDYNDNAFNPLIYDILNSDCLKFSTKGEADKKNTKNILKNIFNIGIVFSEQLLKETVKNKTGVDIEKALDEAIESGKDIKQFMFSEIPNLAELNEQRESFYNFKKYLSAATKEMDNRGEKLVVIIDELDRCKPSFAIQTLEIVKHIFDIENTIFIFAVDLQQLSYILSSVYGQGFDSVGYLCRFFDYIAKMPTPDIKSYVAEKIEEISLIPQIKVESIKEQYIKVHLKDIIVDFFVQVYKGFNFSLRDLDTVLQTYRMMLNNFLKKYEMAGAHMIYIFYMSLKYKKPGLFSKIFISASDYDDAVRAELSPFVERICKENVWIQTTIKNIQIRGRLKNCNFFPLCDGRGKTEYQRACRIDGIKENKVVIYEIVNGRCGSTRSLYPITSDKSMGNVLFLPDLERWDEIKEMTYREFLHKQLEMYNFVTISSGKEEEDHE